jgi:cytosine/adenosine deaminase-related metal-dependent hydrolase
MLPTTLFRRALAPFRVGSLTHAGRALTKHPEVVGLKKQTLRPAYSTDAAIQRTAHDALKQMMRHGVRTMPVLPRYGAIIQCQMPGNFGARWYAAGVQAGAFIGCIGP